MGGPPHRQRTSDRDDRQCRLDGAAQAVQAGLGAGRRDSRRASVTISHRPRGPGAIYAALALGVILLLAILAVTPRQPPPPTIVEFAPQAVEQITDIQTDQAF